MKVIMGTANGFDGPLLARVEKNFSNAYPWCLKAQNADCDKCLTVGYFGKTCDEQNILTNNLPYFSVFSNAIGLSSGDIVFLQPDGHGVVVFDTKVDSNVLVPTNNCNLNCVMCPQPASNTSMGEPNLAQRIVNLLKCAPRFICITGGEPTYQWQAFMDLVKKIHSKFPATIIQILTNGIVLAEFGKAKELSEICGESLRICIPLYSDVDNIHDEIVGKKSAFWSTIEGINNLAREGIYIELRNVVMKYNCSRLAQWATFVSRYLPFIGRAAIMGLEPMGRAKKRISEIAPSHEVLANALSDCIKVFNRAKIPAMLYNFPLCEVPKFLWPFSQKSISEWKRQYNDSCLSCNVFEFCGGFFTSWQNIEGFTVTPIKDTFFPKQWQGIYEAILD
jgi:His-Xaa-Ser system radical SAM maturase HxsC